MPPRKPSNMRLDLDRFVGDSSQFYESLLAHRVLAHDCASWLRRKESDSWDSNPNRPGPAVGALVVPMRLSQLSDCRTLTASSLRVVPESEIMRNSTLRRRAG